MDYNEKIKTKIEQLKNKEDFLILAIETSCDETAAAVTRGRKVLSNIISSQIDIHKRFGGVVPEIASRNHILAIDNVIEEALISAGVQLKDISAVAVTYGAGFFGRFGGSILRQGFKLRPGIAADWRKPYKRACLRQLY